MVAAVGIHHAGRWLLRHARTAHLVPSGPRTRHSAASELGSADERAHPDALEMLSGELYRAPIAIELRLAPRPLKASLAFAVGISEAT